MSLCVALLVAVVTPVCSPLAPGVGEPTPAEVTAVVAPLSAALVHPEPQPEPVFVVAEPFDPTGDPVAEAAMVMARIENEAEAPISSGSEPKENEAGESPEPEGELARAVHADHLEPDSPSGSEAWSVDWYALARCESGYGGEPNWHINTGNGYYGGLQFDINSWVWAGGERYAPRADLATPEQQMTIAEELKSIHPAGLGAWPACTRKLGWR